MKNTPKLEDVVKGITDINSIEDDLWGVGKIPADDFDILVDIGSGDGVFSSLVSRYHNKAVIIKADWRDKCNADDVIPVHIGGSDAASVFISRPSVGYCDITGRPIVNILCMEAVTAMGLHEFLDTYTQMFPNNRMVLKLSDVSVEHVTAELPYIHNVKALILILPTTRERSSVLLESLKHIFEIVEDYSSGEVLYVRCYHVGTAYSESNNKLLGPGDNEDNRDDNNNA